MRSVARALPVLAALAALGLTREAAADQLVIKFPGQHPDYVFEAEPHVLLAPFHRFFPGAGFRGSIELVDNGFVPSINNTVAVSFGADWADKGVWLPVAMQWNFWLSRNWSVFGEPGLAFRVGKGFDGRGPNHGFGWLALWVGGRFHFTDTITLTLRLGRPTLSVGVSFLL
jgi:hypothetical protein